MTVVGNVRKLNEDACLSRPDAGIWVVADGMGGHSSGDLASSMIVDGIQQIELLPTLSEAVEQVEDSLLEVNRSLRHLAFQRGGDVTIGSTVVILMAHAQHCLLMWVGDSRAYRYRDGRLIRLTQDHTQVEELVMQGLMEPEEAENHPASNIITRAVGADDALYVDMDNRKIFKGDTYLLCSDGLNKELSDSEIAEQLTRPGSTDEICHSLVDTALERSARDNVTVVLIRAEEKIVTGR
ncbi:MAG: serine/threonine-protein phosphatase [Gammaproteobacteria bacterium]|nr:serine/threonine-protein phosphatase [Gammaproteobacteria bacterium]